MEDVHLRATVGEDGTLTVRGLPSMAGHMVDVLVRECPGEGAQKERYPLRGTHVQYTDPFGGVAENEWDSSK